MFEELCIVDVHEVRSGQRWPQQNWPGGTLSSGVRLSLVGGSEEGSDTSVLFLKGNSRGLREDR